MCRAADCTGIAPIVRVRKNDGRNFDEASTSAVQAFKYLKLKAKLMPKPLSKVLNTVLWVREVFPSLRGHGLYTAAGTNITEKLNEESLVVIHVEGKGGIDNLAEIVTVPQVDVIFLGPYDLSQSIGIPWRKSAIPESST